MSARASRNERGTVTAFVVVFSFALLLVAGLVVDGGRILTSRREAINEAEAAARAGAQALVSPTSGALDPTSAKRMANEYLSRTGHDGVVAISGDTITVDVSFERPMLILGAAGLASTTVHGHGEARGARGVRQEGDL